MEKHLTALYLQHENELKATVPDFAHQLEKLIDVKNKPVNYDEKPVAAYEQEVYYDDETKFHEDFELNVNFLSHFENNMILSLFKKHFPNEQLQHAEQIALLADSFANTQLQEFMQTEVEEDFEAAGAKGKGPHTEEEKEYLDKSKKEILREFEGGLRKQRAEELDPYTERATVAEEKKMYEDSRRRQEREKLQRLREKEMREAKRKQEEGKSTWEKMTSVFTESDEVEEDLITLAMATNVDTDIEPHCGRKKKHKEQELIKPLQYCDTCEFEHADHYRLCANCNEEHDGCCEILA